MSHGFASDISTRLKRTGVMNVENPVERMYRDGSVRELGDDEVEEVD